MSTQFFKFFIFIFFRPSAPCCNCKVNTGVFFTSGITFPKETLIYSVWRCYFVFFETVMDGRVHSCFKKISRLAKRNN